jgi:hypothetical protein
MDSGTLARTNHHPPGTLHVAQLQERGDRRQQPSAPALQKQVRMVLWGGAAEPGDNSAFEFAAQNVVSNYRAIDKGKFIVTDMKRIKVAKDIVNNINSQAKGSIRSLDIFTHGGPQALYLTTASPDTNKLLRYIENNSSLYRTRWRMVFNAAGWTPGSALVAEINFANFTANSKIELHGCRTAEHGADTDNIAAELSTLLYQAGGKASTVVGHADKANPNIKGGGEKNSEQDYRHGDRVVFHNGKIIKTTKQKGMISESEIERLAEKAEQ